MLGRVAAWSCAAVLIVVPARASIEVGTPADIRAAAAVAAAPLTSDLAYQAAGNRADDSVTVAKFAALETSLAPQDRAIDAPAQAIVRPPAAEPFGLAASPVPFGNVLSKWTTVETQIAADNKILARCRDDTASCPAAARDFLAVIAQGRAQTGRARIGTINRAVNLAIEPMSDMAQWGVPDRWSPPLETFATHRGDCEDYAIAKYVALTAAGVPAADVRLIIVRNTAVNEDHAVAAVRLDGHWIVLDNRWLTMVADRDMAQIVPLFVLDDAGVRQFAPLPAVARAQRGTGPASL
jgi:predicted transglutaminase-like cysteine proteinase